MCEHSRLRTVGNRVFCKDCGEEVSLDILYGKAPEAGKGKNSNKPAQESQDRGKKAADGQKAVKSPAKATKAKTAGKTAEKGGNE